MPLKLIILVYKLLGSMRGSGLGELFIGNVVFTRLATRTTK